MKLVFAEDGKKPLVVESSWVVSGSPTPLDLSNARGQVFLRALCILFLLAKYKFYKSPHARGPFIFQSDIREITWIGTLGNAFKEDAKTWIETNLGITSADHFISASPGTTRASGGKDCPKAEFNTEKFPVSRLEFYTKSTNAPQDTAIILDHEKLLPFALKLESAHWKHSAIQDLIRLGSLSQPTSLEILHQHVESKPILSEKEKVTFLKELLYLVRRCDTENTCIKFIEGNRSTWAALSNNSLNDTGDTLLLLAISAQKMGLVKYLLGLKELDVNVSNELKITPLLRAARCNDIPLVKRLLDLHADYKATTAMNWNAIHEAIFGASDDSLELIKLFEGLGVAWSLDGVDLHLALSVAISRKCPPNVISYLLKKAANANLLALKDAEGRTLLYRAYSAGNFDTAAELISRLAKIPNFQWENILPVKHDYDCWFHIHVYSGMTNEICRELEESGEYSHVNLKDKLFGNAPLHLAASHGLHEIVQLLILHNADPFVQDRYGRTPRELLPLRMNDTEIKIEAELKLYEEVVNRVNYLETGSSNKKSEGHTEFRFQNMIEKEFSIYRNNCQPFFSYVSDSMESSIFKPKWDKNQIGCILDNCLYYLRYNTTASTKFLAAAGTNGDFKLMHAISKCLAHYESLFNSFVAIAESLANPLAINVAEMGNHKSPSFVCDESIELFRRLDWGYSNKDFSIVLGVFVAQQAALSDFFCHVCFPLFNPENATVEPLASFLSKISDLKSFASEQRQLIFEYDNDVDLVKVLESIRLTLKSVNEFWASLNKYMIALPIEYPVESST